MIEFYDLDYSDVDVEVDEVGVCYNIDEDTGNYDFDNRVIEIDTINTSNVEDSDHIELKMSQEDFVYFVTSMIDDDNLKKRVKNHLEKRHNENIVKLTAELEAEKNEQKNKK